MQSKKLNIGLIGYGKMGKTIEKLALDKAHKIGLRCNSENPIQNVLDELGELDVAIEFSNPDTAADNLAVLAEHKIPTICGSTAWLDRYKEISELFEQNETAFLYASNFSVGVNVFFSVNKYLAKLMNKLGTYGITMMESHHIEKKDAPSGTAVSLAEQIISKVDRVDTWHLADGKHESSVAIFAKREKDVKGIHEVKYSNSIDEISIRHEAYSREGFASGALLAAEWIHGKKGIYSMDDVLDIH